MEEKLDELYNKLANYILDMIPESVEWNDVNYLGEVAKNKASWSSVFYFKDTEKNTTLQCHKIPETYHVPRDAYRNLLMDLNGVLLEIYDCFMKNGQELWEQLSLSFDAEGKFKIDFFYDVFGNSEMGPLTREFVWAYYTFEYKPEDSYWKGVLEEYLNSQSDKENQ